MLNTGRLMRLKMEMINKNTQITQLTSMLKGVRVELYPPNFYIHIPLKTRPAGRQAVYEKQFRVVIL